ncbi:MAG: hypothetical protein HGA38_04045 [Candidatus Moranbacteria bacterium]|nr:hypothetical protein [Candidatus Moranbacteria bacterium]
MKLSYNPEALDLLKKTFEAATGLPSETFLDQERIEQTGTGSLRYYFPGTRTSPNILILVMGGVKKFISMAFNSDASHVLHYACAQA